MEQIIVAIISGLCVAIPSVIATISASKRAKEDNKKNNDLVIYQINELKDKVKEHNNLVSRMYSVENRVSLLEDNVAEIKHK